MKTLLRRLLHLVFTRSCPVCNRLLLESEEQLCVYCICQLPRAKLHRLPGRPLKKLFDGFPQVDHVAALFIFAEDNQTQRLVHAFKYHGNRQLALSVGRMVWAELSADLPLDDVEYIIPIPLHPRKLRSRGYNQSELIAQGMAARHGKSNVCLALRRTVHTATQTHKSRYERRLNTEHAFELAPEYTSTLEGRHVVLVDDVITTGATLVAAIQALSHIAGIRISILAVSAVRPH